MGSKFLVFQSTEAKNHLIHLETEKAKLLRQQEESWRLKSRAIWLKVRDDNTKFFQQCEKGRRCINIIWEMRDRARRVAKKHAQLTYMGIRYFSNLYRDPKVANIS